MNEEFIRAFVKKTGLKARVYRSKQRGFPWRVIYKEFDLRFNAGYAIIHIWIAKREAATAYIQEENLDEYVRTFLYIVDDPWNIVFREESRQSRVYAAGKLEEARDFMATYLRIIPYTAYPDALLERAKKIVNPSRREDLQRVHTTYVAAKALIR